jgi:hypothetical protein
MFQETREQRLRKIAEHSRKREIYIRGKTIV